MSTHQLCTCTAADYHFGIRIGDVQEVVESPALTPVPLAPVALRGLMNLRGQIVTALDLRRRLALPDAEDRSGSTCMVLRTPEGLLGLLVDSAGDVVDVNEASPQPVPETLSAVMRDVLTGACLLPDRLLLVLDTSRLVQLERSTPFLTT